MGSHYFLQLVCFNKAVQVEIISPINCFEKSFVNTCDQLITVSLFKKEYIFKLTKWYAESIWTFLFGIFFMLLSVWVWFVFSSFFAVGFWSLSPNSSRK